MPDRLGGAVQTPSRVISKRLRVHDHSSVELLRAERRTAVRAGLLCMRA
jgi:hypothetical protein